MSRIAEFARASLEETLEQVAFAPVTVLDDAFDWSEGDLIWAEIALVSPIAGTLVFAGPRATVQPLAADAWGGGADADPGAAFLSEVANIIAGQLLANLYPAREPGIGLPIFGAGARTVARDALSLCVDVDVGRVGLLIELDSQAPLAPSSPIYDATEGVV